MEGVSSEPFIWQCIAFLGYGKDLASSRWVEYGVGKWEEKLHGLGVKTVWDSSDTLYIKEMKKSCFQNMNIVDLITPRDQVE